MVSKVIKAQQQNKTKTKHPSHDALQNILLMNCRKPKNDRGILIFFHFCLLDICWVKRRTLWVSSMGSFFLLVMTAAEWAMVTSCLVNEWMTNEWGSKHPALPLAVPINSRHCLWMNVSLILNHEGYSCFFMVSRILVSPKPKQESSSCHQFGLVTLLPLLSLGFPSIEQRAGSSMVCKVLSNASKLWQSLPKQ